MSLSAASPRLYIAANVEYVSCSSASIIAHDRRRAGRKATGERWWPAPDLDAHLHGLGTVQAPGAAGAGRLLAWCPAPLPAPTARAAAGTPLTDLRFRKPTV